MIRKLAELAEKVKTSGRRHKVAVAWAQDVNTIHALEKAVADGFIEALLIGKSTEISKLCLSEGVDDKLFTIIDAKDEKEASKLAVTLTRKGESDIVMKGLVGTDKFLREVMDKENGLMIPGAVLSYVGAMELPSYHKILFITDPAVIPEPDLDQKLAMLQYSIEMASRFGIEKPKTALIGASEKMSRHSRHAADYAIMCKMADRKQIKDCIIDGPLDLFLACDKSSIAIKGVDTPVNGDADILLFPNLESCNPFYKGMMLFAGGELAGLICGTSKPVIVMSRSESELSKYYCIALACLMA